MSKIGKKLIPIPEGVIVTVAEGLVNVKGPKGELKLSFPDALDVKVDNSTITVTSKPTSAGSALWGLYRALIQNMVIGVSRGFQKTLEFQGVGYKAVVKGSDLELNLGFSHPIVYHAPEGITFSVEKNTITISGADKEFVGRVAADIRARRKPEPYKGSGIKYQGEVLRRKAGKKAVAAG